MFYKKCYLLTSTDNVIIIELNYYSKTKESILNILINNKIFNTIYNYNVLKEFRNEIYYQNETIEIGFTKRKNKVRKCGMLLKKGYFKIIDNFIIEQGSLNYEGIYTNLKNYKGICFEYKGLFKDKYILNYLYAFNNYEGTIVTLSKVNSSNLSTTLVLYIEDDRMKKMKMDSIIKQNSKQISINSSSFFDELTLKIHLCKSIELLNIQASLVNYYFYLDIFCNGGIILKTNDFSLNSKNVKTVSFKSFIV